MDANRRIDRVLHDEHIHVAGLLRRLIHLLGRQGEGAAGVGMGYIDYKVKGNKDNDPTLQGVMRKKRLAFAKFSFIMAIWTLFLLDGPTANCVLPLIIGCGWNTIKMGT